MRKTLKEAKGDGYEAFVEASKKYKVIIAAEKALKEAKLDAADISAVSKIYDEVMATCEPFLTRELALIIETDKEAEIFEVNVAATAGELTAGAYVTTGADTAERTVTVNRDYGVNPNWTRQYLERATWEVMAWQVRETTKSLELELMDYMIGIYLVNFGQSVAGEHDWLDWDDIVDAVAEAEDADSHPDVLLCSPRDYANLLKDDQFISSLYVGDDSTMRSGKVKTTLGMTVIRSSRMPDHMALLLEKEKAGALCVRRSVTVEPYERPEIDEYGFVISHRYGFDYLSQCAVTLISDT